MTTYDPNTQFTGKTTEELKSRIVQREAKIKELESLIGKYKSALEQLANLGGGRSEGNAIAQHALRE